jgi:hypothetical protein
MKNDQITQKIKELLEASLEERQRLSTIAPVVTGILNEVNTYSKQCMTEVVTDDEGRRWTPVEHIERLDAWTLQKISEITGILNQKRGEAIAYEKALVTLLAEGARDQGTDR